MTFSAVALRVSPGQSPPSGPAIHPGKKSDLVVAETMLGRSAAMMTSSRLPPTITPSASRPRMFWRAKATARARHGAPGRSSPSRPISARAPASGMPSRSVIDVASVGMLAGATASAGRGRARPQADARSGHGGAAAIAGGVRHIRRAGGRASQTERRGSAGGESRARREPVRGGSLSNPFETSRCAGRRRASRRLGGRSARSVATAR